MVYRLFLDIFYNCAKKAVDLRNAWLLAAFALVIF